MVKEFYLGLFAAIVCALAALTYAVPVTNISASHYYTNGSLATEQPPEDTLTDDGSIRSERSTNLSHITGSARKIRMYVKNRHLQVLPDGTVNGTSDDTSDFTVLQRTTVNIGQLKIQGVATCQYLCMDSCGLLYGSKEFLDECVFNEMIEQSHYNTYSSARYSNAKRTMYLALNRRGHPRKVQIRAQQQLGKLSTYTRVLTQPVSPERVETLVNRLMNTGGNATHPLRHHGASGHLCAVGGPVLPSHHAQDPAQRVSKNQVAGPFSADSPGVDRLRCRKRKKRKKKRRRCQDSDDEACPKKTPNEKNKKNDKNIEKCESNKKDECQRIPTNKLVTLKKKNNKKTKLGDKQLNALRGVKMKNKKQKTLKNLRGVTKMLKVSQDIGVFSSNATESVVESPQVKESPPIASDDNVSKITDLSLDVSTSSISSTSMEEISSWEQGSTLDTSTMDAEPHNENHSFLSTSPQTN